MNFYDFWWPFLIVGPFLIPEIVAWLDKKPGGTFSEWIWDVYALRKGTDQAHAHLRRALFGTFWAALSGHFFLQTSAVWLFVAAAACVWPVIYHYRNEPEMVLRRMKR